MRPRSASAESPASELGEPLRQWRSVRGKSQIDLSLDTGVSQRHLSFIESGRRVPSWETPVAIAERVDVPLSDRNALVLAAGYAPIYSEKAWDASEMQGLTQAIQRMLRQQNPFPALVMDRYWNALMYNESAPRLFKPFIDLTTFKGSCNLLHFLFHPQVMRPFVKNRKSLARSLIQQKKLMQLTGYKNRMRKELAVGQTGLKFRSRSIDAFVLVDRWQFEGEVVRPQRKKRPAAPNWGAISPRK